MPEFSYQAADRRGQISRGTMVAEDEKSLERRLTEIGYWLIEARLLATKKNAKKSQGAKARADRIF